VACRGPVPGGVPVHVGPEGDAAYRGPVPVHVGPKGDATYEGPAAFSTQDALNDLSVLDHGWMNVNSEWLEPEAVD
jgi:hypothetical protein